MAFYYLEYSVDAAIRAMPPNGRPFGETPTGGKALGAPPLLRVRRLRSGCVRKKAGGHLLSVANRRIRPQIFATFGAERAAVRLTERRGNPRNPTERQNWGCKWIPGRFGFPARHFGFLYASPISGGFVYFGYNFRVRRWCPPVQSVSLAPTDPHGTVNCGITT